MKMVPAASDGRARAPLRRSAVPWLFAALLALPGGSYAASGRSPANVVSGQWTWVAGPTSTNAGAVYGTKGVEAATNDPGARTGAATWTDAAGSLWLFGGLGPAQGITDSYYSDVWRWNPSTGFWAWIGGVAGANASGVYSVQGIPDPEVFPGGRQGAVAWIDASGSLWLLGGQGWAAADKATAPGLLNDLWRFDFGTGLWTWVGGSDGPGAVPEFGKIGIPSFDAFPGARSFAAAWTDAAGSLWLFGGYGVGTADSSGQLADLWKLDSTGLWTWAGGAAGANAPGQYGTRGVPSPWSYPGGREAPVAWSDGKGSLWLFGGYGWVSNGSSAGSSVLNDLWKLDLSSRQWTWISGSNALDPLGVYGTKGTPSPSNVPGGRMGAVGWADSHGHLWLHGGYGLGSLPTGGVYDRLGDLWRFAAAEGEWTWAGGTGSPNSDPVFGSVGLAAPGNDPGSRYSGSSWADSRGNLWLFGGYSGGGKRNDLWAYGNPWSGSLTCAPDELGLCLLGGRFRVTADWGDYGGRTGQGKAISITPDTGYFWFSGASNVEVVAKLVDFCPAAVGGSFSLYATGLTDLDVTLRVTDTLLGGTRVYRNPLGTPFSLLRDAAFGCNAPAGPALAAALLPAVSGPIIETTAWTALLPGVQASCAADGATLCLLDGRFQVRAAYRDYAGNSGTGKALSLTPDTGTFWFFSPGNVEVVAKMVSFCGGGTDNVAVYAGGLTDIQVTLTVTDTATGLTKSYTNPLGTLFQLVRDGPFACR